MSGGVALQAFLSGLALGTAYGLIAMGFSLVYRLTGVISFAHGDFVVGGVFIGVLVVLGSTPVAAALDVVHSVGLAVLIVAAGAALSAGVYFVAVRPFLPGVGHRSTRGDVLGWVAGGLAAGLLIREVLGLVLTQDAYAVPDPLRLGSLTPSGVLQLPGGETVSVRALGVIGIGLAVGILVERLLVLTPVGTAMKAVSEDPTAAALLGLPVRRLVLVAFVVAGALAGLAGLLISPDRSLGVDDGVVLGLKAMAAALVGGLGSVRGALAGGLALGVIESFVVASSVLGPHYADVVPLTILLIVLALGRRGLRSALREDPE
ncbi:branched-chain amino acid ABC transporter permease [Planotetraspora silvatica]|uniref:Branched-chain amino acid ABC transporter permease n=1 Tax=Planotetraspora silvatica TaxID=234614 RepID=A0A8J3USK4_9ACTN|nr:branched-chain amino acid ABC transporter permease [Planotetraspora silvatica]GII49032.1 branched-chain amino acid ABC transporter permease [Planotetraspora silvatica]